MVEARYELSVAWAWPWWCASCQTEDVQHVEKRQLALGQRRRNLAQSVVAVGGQGLQQPLARFAEDLRESSPPMGMSSSGLLPPRKRGHSSVHLAGLSGRQPLGGKDLLGNADVHQLPADVGPAGTQATGQRRRRIGQLFDLVERGQRARAIELEAASEDLNRVHGGSAPCNARSAFGEARRRILGSTRSAANSQRTHSRPLEAGVAGRDMLAGRPSDYVRRRIRIQAANGGCGA